VSCVISDPGSIVASFNEHRGAIATNVGVVAGVAAAATGVGAVAEVAAGATALGAGLGVASFGAGVTAAALDNGACVHGNAAACLGRDFGYTGAVLGAFATGAAGASAIGVISVEGWTSAILGGVGAAGLNLGLAGTTLDIFNALSGGEGRCR